MYLASIRSLLVAIGAVTLVSAVFIVVVPQSEAAIEVGGGSTAERAPAPSSSSSRGNTSRSSGPSASTFTSSSLFSPTPISNQTFQLSGGNQPTSQQLFNSTPTSNQQTSLSGGSYSGSGGGRSVTTIPISGSSLSGSGGSTWIGGAPTLSSGSFSGGSTGLLGGNVQVIDVVETVCGTVSWSDNGSNVSCSTGGGCRATAPSCTQSQIDEAHARIRNGEEVTVTNAQGVEVNASEVLSAASGSSLLSSIIGQFFGFNPSVSRQQSDPWESFLFSGSSFEEVDVPFIAPTIQVDQSQTGLRRLADQLFFGSERMRTAEVPLQGGATGVRPRGVETQPYSGFFSRLSIGGQRTNLNPLGVNEFLDGASLRTAQEFGAYADQYAHLFGGAANGDDIAAMIAANVGFENPWFDSRCSGGGTNACGIGQYIPSTWNAQYADALAAARDIAENGTASERQAAQAFLLHADNVQRQGGDPRGDPQLVAGVLAHHKASNHDAFSAIADRFGLSIETVAQMEHFGPGYLQALVNNPNGTNALPSQSAFLRQNPLIGDRCSSQCTPLQMAQIIEGHYQGRPAGVADTLLGTTDRFGRTGQSVFGGVENFVAALIPDFGAGGQQTVLQAIDTSFGNNAAVGGNPVEGLFGFMPFGGGQQTTQEGGGFNPFGIIGVIGEHLGPALSGAPVDDEEFKKDAFNETLRLLGGIGQVSGNDGIRVLTDVIGAALQTRTVRTIPVTGGTSRVVPGVRESDIGGEENGVDTRAGNLGDPLAFGLNLIRGVVQGARLAQNTLGNSNFNLDSLEEEEIQRVIELAPEMIRIAGDAPNEEARNQAVEKFIKDNNLYDTVYDVLPTCNDIFQCVPGTPIGLNRMDLWGIGSIEDIRTQFSGVEATLRKALDIVSITPEERLARNNPGTTLRLGIPDTPGTTDWNGHDADLNKAMENVIEQAQQLVPFDIEIRDGHRTEEENEAVGGATHSQHLGGAAVDISLEGLNNQERTLLVQALIASGAKRIGAYSGNTGLHVDMAGSYGTPEGYAVYPMFDRSIGNMANAPMWFVEGVTTDPGRVAVLPVQQPGSSGTQGVPMPTQGSSGTGGVGSGTRQSGGSGSSGGVDVGGLLTSLTSGGGQSSNPAQQILCTIGNLGSFAVGLGGTATQQGIFPALLGNIFGGIMGNLAGGCKATTTPAVVNPNSFGLGGSATGGQQGMGGLFSGLLSSFGSFFAPPSNTGTQSGNGSGAGDAGSGNTHGTSSLVPRSADVAILASPPAIESGTRAKLTWSSTGTNACIVFDPDGKEIARGGASGFVQTAPIARSAVFRVACRTHDNVLISSAAIVSVFGYPGAPLDKALPSNIQF